jgi:hypothetical protein
LTGVIFDDLVDLNPPYLMHEDLNKMDLASIRNLFLEEMQALLFALEVETPEQLNQRKDKIRQIDFILEQKKLQAKSDREKLNTQQNKSS